ncbi:histidine kinase [Paenibacillus sp. CGMCC 1.16610]|uniref:histidine kinase n=1 Tax=Paenibacillus anseongense TaxID=2682845 RepID=A0ABW9UHM1_9BACL|nr:sensor histidine kinase [Paenibacillus sp. CGMCC 1.16610]MBA2938591.1 histidine kinase [Paenibacillus sp. CGMCC 1.16610]MVQ38782.1 HAMP domain-containing protein [Paenibacillus anseongense]
MQISRLKLKHQILLIFTFSIIIFTSMELYFYYSFYDLTQKRASNYGNKIIEQTRQKIDTVFNDLEVSTNIVVNNKKIQEFTIADDDYKRAFDIGAYVIDLMEYMRSFNSYVNGIVINDSEGRRIYSLATSNGDIFFFNQYAEFINSYKLDSESVEKGMYTDILKDEKTGSEYFFYIAPIIEAIGGVRFSQQTGYCSVMVNTDRLQELVKNTDLTPNSTLYLLNSRNEVIASNNTNFRGILFKDILSVDRDSLTNGVKTNINGEDVIVQEKDLEQADGWRIVSIIPVHELTTDMNAIKNVSIIAGVGIILSLIILGYFFLNNLTRPVMGLVADMKRIGKRDMGFRIKVRSTNEVGVLAYDINSMIDQMEEMASNILNTQARLYESEISKKQVEFSALQSQINPHFLYNTLNCISSIGLEYGSKEIAQITSSMSKIFRYSIKEDELVQISEEIQCVQAYMNIISIRYENKFMMKVHVDDKIMQMKTPKMILQPIIENSVYHGLERRDAGGSLHVNGQIDVDGDVCFQITDSGIGIGHDELEVIKAKLNMDYSERVKNSPDGKSIGLSNINNRIKLMFGEGYGVDIESQLGRGTTVIVKIPSISN